MNKNIQKIKLKTNGYFFYDNLGFYNSKFFFCKIYFSSNRKINEKYDINNNKNLLKNNLNNKKVYMFT